MSKTPTQNDWEEKMRSELLEKLDFLSDHWIKGDDRPPFNFGGWREEVADDFIKIYRSYLADARREVIDSIHGKFCEFAIQGGDDEQAQKGILLYARTLQYLATLRKEGK